MRLILEFVIPIAVAIYALVDCASRSDEQVANLPRWAWILLIIFLPVLGSIAFLIAGRKGRKGPGPSRRRFVAPDDDPDFLKGL